MKRTISQKHSKEDGVRAMREGNSVEEPASPKPILNSGIDSVTVEQEGGGLDGSVSSPARHTEGGDVRSEDDDCKEEVSARPSQLTKRDRTENGGCEVVAGDASSPAGHADIASEQEGMDSKGMMSFDGRRVSGEGDGGAQVEEGVWLTKESRQMRRSGSIGNVASSHHNDNTIEELMAKRFPSCSFEFIFFWRWDRSQEDLKRTLIMIMYFRESR